MKKDYNSTILAIDFGNSAMKLAIFNNVTGKASMHSRILLETVNPRSYTKLGKYYGESFLTTLRDRFPNIDTVIYATVNPRFSDKFLKGFKELTNDSIPCIEINHSNSFSFISNVDFLNEVGIDLLCACEAAVMRERKLPTFILDLGTYSKLIFLNYFNDTYILEGVNIGPGIWNMAKAGILPKHISKKGVSLNYFSVPYQAVGKNTVSSFQNGNGMMFANMFTATIEQIAVHYLETDEEERYAIDVIVCGGGTNLMKPTLEMAARFFLDYELAFEENLTMEGIFTVYSKNFLVKNGDAS